MIKVVHCKKEPYDVYIGRPSKWGNPFAIGKDGTREEVIEKYRQYLLRKPELMAAPPELEGKTLGCWCKPKACHGDVLAEMAAKKAVEAVDLDPEFSKIVDENFWDMTEGEEG